MNERSTRAHTVIVVHLESCSDIGAGDAMVSRSLCLVDLGGAEQVSKSILSQAGKRVVASGDVAARMQEAVYINMGLLALNKCVRALVNDDPHIPFNDSKLTMMLRAALKGNCATSLIVTCSLQDSNAAETVEALRFGEAARGVLLQAGAAGVPLTATAQAALAKVEHEIEEVQEVIRAKERWITTPIGDNAGVTAGGDFAGHLAGQAVTRIVGAEAEHARLEALLMRRLILSGLP